jgi:phosphoribosylaminoimidazole (AIR) synthetase
MGIGYCVVCSKKDAERAISIAKKHKLKAQVIGSIVKERKVTIKTETSEFEV